MNSKSLRHFVWHTPKGRLLSFVKSKCESIPPNRRMTVVAIMLTVFILIALGVFGHACYRLGQGHVHTAIEIKHIPSLDSPEKVNHEIPGFQFPEHDI